MVACLIALVFSYPSDWQTMTQQVSSERLRATVEKLASFPTRNTNHPLLFEAAEWLAGEFRKIPNIDVELMRYTLPAGRRVPEEKEVVQVVARLKGESDRIVLVGAHMDSLNLREGSLEARAPGANDDASGCALVLELARILSTKRWKNTLMFVCFSGEEQGLLGARALATKAKAEGWQILAMLNNDTVGSSANLQGQSDPLHVRLFSDEGENHNSRELARFIEFVTRNQVAVSQSPQTFFNVKLVFRRDRIGRGGDHTPFAEQGFSAVRFVEVAEEYTRQHTPEDLPQYLDYSYLANVTRINLIAISHLADSEPPPQNVEFDKRQGHDTTLRWQSQPGVEYVVYWRETTSPVWQFSKEVGAVNTYTLQKINKDDHIFAVGSKGGIPVTAR
jgi:hypothetical protein